MPILARIVGLRWGRVGVGRRIWVRGLGLDDSFHDLGHSAIFVILLTPGSVFAELLRKRAGPAVSRDLKRIRDRLRVEVSPDGLQATVEAVRRMPRMRLSVQSFSKLLAERGVTHGLLPDAIAQFIDDWGRGHSGRVVVARGEAPVPGMAPELRRVHPPARSGRDPAELLPLFVAAGENVFAVRGASAPAPGRTVCDTPVPPPATATPELPVPGEGFELVGRLWRAERDGFLEYEGESIRVSSDLIHKYDLPAGDYHWPGSARIDGSICEGVRLQVDGDLHVGGDVGRGVRIRVGGDAVIEGAVRGEGRARVEVDGSLACAAVFGCFIYATGDVRVSTLCQGTTVRTCGRFFNELPGGLVSSSRIDAVRGARLNDIIPGSGLPSAVHVGTSEWLDDEWHTVEAEIQRWSRHHAHLFEEFHERYAHLVKRRSDIYRLPESRRQQYEREHDRVVEEQERVDRNISRLRTRQTMLLQSRCRDETAVVHVIGLATAGSLFSIRRVPLAAGSEGLREVVLALGPSRNRVISIPKSIYDSSLEEELPLEALSDHEDVQLH